MPPKKQKDNNKQPRPSPEAQNTPNNVPQEQNNEAKSSKSEPFKCICGKTYGSLAAVHTHINNKHGDQKKKYKAQIVNPKKTGQPSMNSIRMKDINYNEIQAELMCLGDINLKDFYQFYTQIHKDLKEGDILINVNEDLSDDSDLQLQGMDGEVVVETESKRRREINEQINQLTKQNKVEQIINAGKNDKQLETFRQEKFKLNLVYELSKFFIVSFASKVEFSLILIHACQKLGASKSDQTTQINAVLDDIWKTIPKIRVQLVKYYREWNKIRFDYKNWKSQQSKNEKIMND